MKDSRLVVHRFSKLFSLLMVLGLMVAMIAFPAVQASANALGIPDSEYNALVAIYNSTGGPNWTNHTNWLTSSTPWYGVTVTGGHVYDLYLFSNQVTGPIPAELSNLSNLRTLYLRGNELTGQIPAELGNMSNLSLLDLSNNRLTGQIPAAIGNLTNLGELDLSSNNLIGEIPATLKNLTGLPQIQWGWSYHPSISGNALSAPAGNSSLMSFLNNVFRDWQSAQTVPPSNVTVGDSWPGGTFVSWTPILYTGNSGYYEVGVSQTPGGPYTFSAGNRTVNKSASSMIVQGLAAGSTQYLVVRSVTLAGSWNKSVVTSLPSTEVTAYVPATGALGIPDSEYNALAALYASTNALGWLHRDNWFTGNTPWYGLTVANGHVASLDLTSNQLTGQIPVELGNLTNLQYLSLADNQLTGQIPAELGSLTSLRSLQLGLNHLSGQIPTQMGSLTALTSLGLNSNQLSGQIPAQLGNLTNLRSLILDRNQLSGAIPSSLTNLSALQGGEVCSLDYNALSASDPSLIAFLASKFEGWQNRQTVPPANVTAAMNTLGGITVSWTPIPYTWNSGYYELGVSQTSGGPYTFSTQNRTAGKSASSLSLMDLVGTHYFVVRTVTLANSDNQSTLTSLASAEVTLTVPSNPLYVKINLLTNPEHNLRPWNPIIVAGRVTSASPLKINDGGGEITVSGMTASVGQFVFVTGNWNGSVLTAIGSPVVYN